MSALNSILVLLAAFLAVFGEAAFGGFRHLLGAQIHFLPALIVYASLSTNVVTMTLCAVFGGLLFDALSANPIGVTTLPLFTVGFLIYCQRDLILREQLFAQLVLGGASSAIVPCLTVLLLMTKGQVPLLGWGSLWQLMVVSLGGALATPLIFRLFGIFDRTLNYSRATETSFRPDREIRRGKL